MIDQHTTQEAKSWVKNSVTLKLIIVFFLMLLLLIPSAMIQNIITERQWQKADAITEVGAKWAKSQQLNGPMLTIPLVYEYGDSTKTETTRYLHVLPEELNINGKMDPFSLHRGIYEIVVYKSNLHISGSFALNQDIDRDHLKEIRYDQAFLTIGISDLKGIEDKVKMNWQGELLRVSPGSKIPQMIASGITVKLPTLPEDTSKPLTFDFQLNLQGSENLSFIPLGTNTNVTLSSDWNAPSFNGNYIPDHREVGDSGFVATWKVLELNRNFPQTWVGSKLPFDPDESAFGVDLKLSLDDYQKSMRSSKYAIMTIALTFLIFFLVEVINKTKIHPFQYALVGLALCLFYVLLISISEHSNFNLAFSIASVATILMISLYSISIFPMKKLTAILTLVLSGIYAFLFTTLQLTDYALLMGSIGLMVILAATMYFTRNINWYGTSLEQK